MSLSSDGLLCFPTSTCNLASTFAPGRRICFQLALWGEAGYFDNLSETNLLLHLGSLRHGGAILSDLAADCVELHAWITSKRSYALLTLVFAIALHLPLLDRYHNRHEPGCDVLLAADAVLGACYRKFACLVCRLQAEQDLYASASEATYPQPLNSVERWEGPWRPSRQHHFPVGAALIVFGLLLLSVRPSAFRRLGCASGARGHRCSILAGPQAGRLDKSKVLSNRIAIWFGVISFPLLLSVGIGSCCLLPHHRKCEPECRNTLRRRRARRVFLVDVSPDRAPDPVRDRQRHEGWSPGRLHGRPRMYGL